MTLEIISAHEIAFSGEADSVTLPGVEGSFTVLKNHAPLISVLSKGIIRYTGVDGTPHEFEIAGGLVDVNDNKIAVCVY